MLYKGLASLCVSFLFCPSTTEAQFDQHRYQLGVSAGGFIYQGDLTPSAVGSYGTIKPAIQLFGAKFFNRSFSARANIAFGSLQGNDAIYGEPSYRQQRNFKFNAAVSEFSVKGEWNVLGRNFIERGFAPYVFAGLGLGFFKIQRDYSQTNLAYFAGTESEFARLLSEDVQRTPPRVLPVVPVGAGVRYYLSDRIGIGFETSYRIMGSDYLDGFSKSANASRGDHYYSHTIGVVYRLGKRDRLSCPKVP